MKKYLFKNNSNKNISNNKIKKFNKKLLKRLILVVLLLASGIIIHGIIKGSLYFSNDNSPEKIYLMGWIKSEIDKNSKRLISTLEEKKNEIFLSSYC